jgi:Asp-tRNA(Asn)/Glu-tRNA(Gln) amidotransferase A subunit family amidase
MQRRELAKALAMLAPLLGLEGQDAAKGPTREELRTALKNVGLDFRDDALDMALANLKRSQEGFARLRAVNVDAGVDPAFTFSPLIPGYKLPEGPARFVMSKAPALRWKEAEELGFRSVRELGHLIRTQKISSQELTELYLGRMKRHMGTLLCTITLTEDLALEQAKAADADLRRGKYRGPLHGIPYGAKDLFATKGIKTTWGAEPYKDQVIDRDATVITRMREAGAVLLGKLSMGALAMGGLWFGGMTKTPWNVEQTSSGSSAGSASATAAGLVGFALGTETLGSIISPSTRCGVTGLRPTFGRVPRTGAMALSWTMDKIGPICRSAEDCMLVLGALHGPDGEDMSARYTAPLHWDANASLRGKKLGILRKDFEGVRQAERKAAYAAAIEVLKKTGAELVDAELPEFPSQAVTMMLSAEAAAAFDDLTRTGGIDQLTAQGPGDWPNTFRSNRTTPAVEYIRAARVRTLLMRQFGEWFAKYDALVSPNTSATLGLTNLTGHPQMVVPCGFPKEGPVGLMFTGKLFEEGMLARWAMAYQQGSDWHRRMPPGFDVAR